MERILVVGSGAREHALAWKIAQDSPKKQIFAAPGNPGIGEIAEIATDVESTPFSTTDVVGLADFAKENKIDFTIVGPEAALAAGVVDKFQSRNLVIFGLTKEAAQIETSKAWSKWLMGKHNIPTARFKTFNPQDFGEAVDYIKSQDMPVVIKQSGIAAGKGVVEAFDLETALGVAATHLRCGSSIVVEEYLEGDEVSVTAICKRRDYIKTQVKVL